MKGLILTYVLGYGGAVVALINPLVGLFVYTLFSIVRPQVIFGFAGNLGGMSEVIGLAMLVGWTLRGLGDWRLQKAWPAALWLLAFFGWVCLSATAAPNAPVAWREVIERAKVVLPFLVGVTLIREPRWLWRYAWLLVLAHGYVAFEVNLSYYVKGYNIAQEGLFGDNNSFAITMVAAAGPAIFLGMSAERWWQKALAFGSAALIMHTVILTFSRGGLLALIISGAAVAIVMPKRTSYVLAMVVAVLLAVRLAGPQVTARFSTTFAAEEERDSSAQSRVELWKDCLMVMGQYPLLGVGPNHWPLIADEFGWTQGKSAHSLWLQTGAEIGIPGLLFLLAFYSVGIIKGLKLGRRHDPQLSPLGLYVFSGLIGFAVAAQFVSLTGLEFPYYLVLVGAMADQIGSQPDAVRTDTAPALMPPLTAA